MRYWPFLGFLQPSIFRWGDLQPIMAASKLALPSTWILLTLRPFACLTPPNLTRMRASSLQETLWILRDKCDLSPNLTSSTLDLFQPQRQAQIEGLSLWNGNSFLVALHAKLHFKSDHDSCQNRRTLSQKAVGSSHRKQFPPSRFDHGFVLPQCCKDLKPNSGDFISNSPYFASLHVSTRRWHAIWLRLDFPQVLFFKLLQLTSLTGISLCRVPSRFLFNCQLLRKSYLLLGQQINSLFIAGCIFFTNNGLFNRWLVTQDHQWISLRLSRTDFLVFSSCK